MSKWLRRGYNAHGARPPTTAGGPHGGHTHEAKRITR
jgi:hypothetical protein